jgi:hypothetical protein
VVAVAAGIGVVALAVWGGHPKSSSGPVMSTAKAAERVSAPSAVLPRESSSSAAQSTLLSNLSVPVAQVVSGAAQVAPLGASSSQPVHEVPRREPRTKLRDRAPTVASAKPVVLPSEQTETTTAASSDAASAAHADTPGAMPAQPPTTSSAHSPSAAPSAAIPWIVEPVEERKPNRTGVRP